MKPKLFLLLTLLLSTTTYAQINLAPNPSFEDTVYCPYLYTQIDACANWLNFGNSPDYFNACDPTGLNVPNSSFGFQYAHTGNAMAGVIMYYKPNSSAPDNYREFIGVQLSSPLIIGQKYYYSFYTNFSAQFQNSIACNKMGLNFTNVQYDELNWPPLINNSQLYTDSILMDSILWVRLSGSFFADSAYQYLVIGNFFDDNNTDTIEIGLNPVQSYYYIDDVCVSTDSIFNSTWTGISQTKSNKVNYKIYPNPSSESLNIKADLLFTAISIIDIQGKVVLNFKKINKNNYSIDVSNLSSGIYVLRMGFCNTMIYNKILINH